MSEPECPQKAPYMNAEEPGKKAWCSCGRTKNQPYCDGSHAGTEFRPVICELDRAKTVAWCGCRKTKSPPFCDGTHASL